MDQKYTAYFIGKLRKGHDKDYVSVALSVKMGLSTKQIESLFKERRTKIKSNLSKDEALFLAKKFYHCGLILHVRKIKNKHDRTDLRDKTALEKQNFKALLSGQCSHPDVSFVNKLAVFFNLVLTLALPILYVSFVVLIAIVLYQYLTDILPGLLSSTQGVYYHILLKYIPPSVGLVLLMFLVKPLLVPYKARPRELLRRSKNSRFYELSDAVADYVGSKKPGMIFVNNDTCATASFYGGFKGFLSGKMVLTLGMPLVNGLTIQQLSGVMAHEFGHFSQPVTVRAKFLVNVINAWLYSRAYENDLWDEKVKILQEKTTLGVWQVLLGLYVLCVSFVRIMMRLLLSTSIKISYALSKKMELDADRYEVEVAGSKGFKGTSLKLRLLSMARDEVQEINEHSYDKTFQLFEDLPAAIVDTVDQYDSSIVSMIEEELDHAQMYTWGNHPADVLRIQHAEKLNKQGVIQTTLPAKMLIPGIQKLNKRVTYNEYSESLLLLNAKDLMVQNSQVQT